MSSFECEQCGACCRRIGVIPAMHEHDRGDGVCKHLTGDNRCAVYATRPLLCQVDALKPSNLTVLDWHALNKEACKRVHLNVYGEPLPSCRGTEL